MSVAPTLDRGTRLAGYTVEAEVGRGAMGWVYRARHDQLARVAAIKVLPPHLAEDSSFRERFIRESQLIAAIEHPNIVPIYDAGEADGLLYIAMRYVDGDDLKSVIKERGGLPLEETLAIVEQAAAALDAAHDRDLVHRDVKPANILIEAGSAHAFLTDFGIASHGKSSGLTKPGLFLGTVDYAPPEQIKGEPLDAAVDVYALGCVLYESLAGTPPFPKETDVAVVHAHLLDPAPVLSAARSDLPAALDVVITTALAKEAAQRYGSCGELLAAARDATRPAPTIAPALSVPPAAEAAVVVPAARRVAAARLPPSTTRLLGREEELAEADELLRRAEVRLVTLTGPGGTGKTRLAVELAQRLQESSSDDVHFVDLTEIRDPQRLLPTIAEALGVEEPTPETSLVDTFAAYLQDVRALIVLDNFEQVIGAAPIVADLLASVPTLKVLVTSRAPLRLRGEHEYPVLPLAVPDVGDADVESAARSPAVALFVTSAQAVNPKFALTEENARAVVALCARLDGLPLAIELAAARAKILSPQALQSRLENSLQLLTGGPRDLPSRHQTLRATLDWSYDLLDRKEQLLLARLAVFAGGCSLEAAEQICADGDELDAASVQDGLLSLVDNGLLRGHEGPDADPRFTMLQTVHEYALFRLIENGELDRVRARHLAWYLARAEEAEPQLLGPEQAGWIAALEPDAANLRAAMSWSLENGELERGLRIAGALVRFWSVHGHMTAGRQWLDRALLAGDVDPAVRAKAVYASGYAALGQGDYADATGRFEESLALSRDLGDAGGVARSLAQLGWLLVARGDIEQATALSEESLLLAREAGDRATESGALANLAEAAYRRSEYDAASALFEESLRLRRQLGDRRNTANALLNLGRTQLRRGDRERAVALLDEGLALARELGDTWSISVALGSLAEAALQREDPVEARVLLAEALTAAQTRGDKRVAAELLQRSAAVAAVEGDVGRAARLMGAADALRTAIGAAPSPDERAIEAASSDAARASVGAEDFDALFESGGRLELDQAVALALSR